MKDLLDSDFENLVVNSDKPVLIDFWANWCGPCKVLMPILEEISTEMSNEVTFYKMNIDENSEIPSALGIRGIPNLVLFKDGKTIATRVGGAPKDTIKNWIKESINKD